MPVESPGVVNQTQPIQKNKIHYLDNIKILLTVLVIIHHAIITYGGPGSWYYIEPTSSTLAKIIMTLVVSTNQSFFMGFFFFMSALFIESSYDKKGSTVFLADRLKRLGIPLLFYTLCLGVLLNYLITVYGRDDSQTFLHYVRYYDNWVDFGVLWFVAALLAFTLLFAVFKKLSADSAFSDVSLPSNFQIILFAMAAGVITFVVRIFFPLGWVLRPLGFQLAHFTQYILLFAFGIVAMRNKWLESLTYQQGKKLLWLPVVLVFVGFPCLYVIKTITHSDLLSFSGGLRWQSLLISMWEQVTGISIVVVMLSIGKIKWNSTSPFLKSLSRSAFAAYIIHPLFLVGFALLLRPLEIDKVLKLLILIPSAISVTFLVARVLVKVPGVRNVI